MDVNSILRNNRKNSMLKQFVLDITKHRTSKKDPKISSIIYSNNDNNVVVSYNNGKMKSSNDIMSIIIDSKLSDTNITTNGKRLSDIEKGKMYPAYRCNWTYGEKTYVSKPGVIFDVSSGENEKKKYRRMVFRRWSYSFGNKL